MLRFLKKKKHPKPSPKQRPPEGPTYQTTDIGAERGRDSEDIGNGGSWISDQDGNIGIKRLTAPNAPTPTPGHEDGHGGGHDLVRSRGLRAKERGRVDRALGRTAFAVDIAKGPAEAFTPLKAILGSISILYAKYQNTVAVKDKIEILCSRIVALEMLFEQPASDEKEIKRRIGLSSKLKAIEGQLLSLHGKSVVLRLADNVQDSEDVNGLLEDLQEAVGNYMMAQQITIYDQGCKLMDAATSAVLNNFRSANGAEFRHGERKGCLKGTRGAILNGIELWARDFDEHSVYWLNGLAGTGKSTIARTTAERLFADGRLGASFFCSRDFEDRRNLQFIFPTLATQLARKYAEFRSILVPLIRSDPNIAYESLYNQMEKLIVRPLNESKISTVVVIDALDECEDEESASAILSVLGRLVPEVPTVKFFLTGRPESRISIGFHLPLLAQVTDVFVLHEVKPSQVGSDIQLFFKNSFSELADRRGGLDNWPTEEQMIQLCERAAGLFVYAAATVKFIDNNKRDPRKQLNILLKSQKIGGREGKTLDLLYTSILREAFGDEPEYDDVTRSVIGAVVLATNPLSPSSIATLLEIEAEEVPLLLSSVNSLLTLQEDINHPVRPFHKSFPDFITDPARCTNERFRISPPDHHIKLLIGCLNLMNRTLEKNMCKLPDGVTNSDIGDLKERVERYTNPALRYACTSWHTHLVDAHTTPVHAPRAITPILHYFLETKFPFWLEVLSVLGAVGIGTRALQAAVGWLEESPTFNLAVDCFRFLTTHFEVVSASSPHIYHSALALSPKESIVRTLYEAHTHPFMRIVHGVPMAWDTNTAAAMFPSRISLAVWSPCDRFIAIACVDSVTVEVLDSVTLQTIQTLESPKDVSTDYKALVFSPDSRIFTCFCADAFPTSELCIVSWDLQTGGVVGVIRQRGPGLHYKGKPSITYSADGKTVGVLYYCWQRSFDANTASVLIFNVAPRVFVRSHSLDRGILLSNSIWARGESMRFATADATTISVWEVGFTQDDAPTRVETLPAPSGLDPRHTPGPFLPAAYRFAPFSLDTDEVTVWDARNSKPLLHCTDIRPGYGTSFSSDGCYFACPTAGSEICLWKESLNGYVLHRVLTSGVPRPTPLLSTDGKSLVAFGGHRIRLWPTEDLTTTAHPTVFPRALQRTENFVLGFSPDGMFAAVAMQQDNLITILNLKSGALQLTIDTMENVHGVAVVGDTVVVISGQSTLYSKVTARNLPAGDWVSHAARAGPTVSCWEISPRGSQYRPVATTSISSVPRRIAFSTDGIRGYLCVHNASPGENPWGELTGGSTPTCLTPNLGREVRYACSGGGGEACGCPDTRLKEPIQWVATEQLEHPPDIEGYPWESPRGYQVTNDWWVLGPDGERLLMLPPHWRSYAVRRVWEGHFLALLHRGLSEPVILEFDVKP